MNKQFFWWFKKGLVPQTNKIIIDNLTVFSEKITKFLFGNLIIN